LGQIRTYIESKVQFMSNVRNKHLHAIRVLSIDSELELDIFT